MDYELASENLKYCADTGILWWITSSRGRRAGKVAGSNTTIGGKPHYNIIGFQGKSYLSHRVACLIFYKDWPDDQIEHINVFEVCPNSRTCSCIGAPFISLCMMASTNAGKLLKLHTLILKNG
jgi:hypothetical protein